MVRDTIVEIHQIEYRRSGNFAVCLLDQTNNRHKGRYLLVLLGGLPLFPSGGNTGTSCFRLKKEGMESLEQTGSQRKS